MKLTKFKAKETDKKRIIISTGVILIIALVLVVFSYSLYQNVDEVQFVNGTVGTFKQLALKEITATSTQTSIDLSYIVEGIGVNTTCKYGLEEGTYDKEATNVTNTNCNIEELNADILYYYQVCATNSGGEVCKEGSIKTKPNTTPISIVNIGDYISMTPTATAYKPPSSVTGLVDGTSGQNGGPFYQSTLNPSELNVWRVIRKNADGTVEVVSEYVSSTNIYFYGQTGYLNFVGGLNTIAAQYTNEKYVSKTRHMGYSNQTAKCPSISSCPADTEYTADTNLVQAATGTLVGKDSIGKVSSYWLASREIFFTTVYFYSGRIVASSGIVDKKPMFRSEPYSLSYGNKIRPILTLKADVEIVSGDGQSEDTAYQLD